MSPAPNPTPIQASAPDIARRVGLILGGLAALVALRFLRDPRLVPLIGPLWTRLTRTVRRFDRLMTRIAANRLPKPRPPRPHRPKPATARPANPLPTGYAWLIRAIPYEAAGYASQLNYLLAEPATVALFAAHPGALRLLRPFGRMLALDALAPKRIRKKRAPKAAAPREAPPPRPPLPQHTDPSYRPSAQWPRKPWPAHRPSEPWWPAGPPRRPAPA